MCFRVGHPGALRREGDPLTRAARASLASCRGHNVPARRRSARPNHRRAATSAIPSQRCGLPRRSRSLRAWPPRRASPSSVCVIASPRRGDGRACSASRREGCPSPWSPRGPLAANTRPVITSSILPSADRDPAGMDEAVAIDLELFEIEERIVGRFELVDRIAAERDDTIEDRQPLVIGAARRSIRGTRPRSCSSRRPCCRSPEPVAER